MGGEPQQRRKGGTDRGEITGEERTKAERKGFGKSTFPQYGNRRNASE